MRNAFGNLYNILKEVSYSGMMASYLTYQVNSVGSTRSLGPMRIVPTATIDVLWGS